MSDCIAGKLLRYRGLPRGRWFKVRERLRLESNRTRYDVSHPIDTRYQVRVWTGSQLLPETLWCLDPVQQELRLSPQVWNHVSAGRELEITGVAADYYEVTQH